MLASYCSQHAFANLAEQCTPNIPVYDKPLLISNPKNQPVTINADESHIDYPKSVLFTGNVKIEQGNSTLTGNQVVLSQMQNLGKTDTVRIFTATGDVHYSDPQVILTGAKAWLNLNTQDKDIYTGDYKMVGHQGRGVAYKIKVRGSNRYTIIENGTFTSCLPGDNSWSVIGSEIIYDRIEEVAEVWNARFRINDIAVFYSPYMQLPIGKKRRSGFLIPNTQYGRKNGLEFILPYYWNIAPNYDITFTPHYISKRGLEWKNEFRYLMQPGSGRIALDWLPNDKDYKKDYTNNKTRWLFQWNHHGLINQAWRFNIDFKKVSDARYFTDLDSKYGSATDGYAPQKFSIGYTNKNWSAILSSKQFQIFDSANNSNFNTYKVQPQLDLNYYKNNLGPFDFHLYGQIAKFHSINPYSPNATRWHLESTLDLPLANSWGSLNTETKLFASHYQQSIPSYFSTYDINKNNNNYYKDFSPYLDNSVNRVLSQFKADGKLIFQRLMILSEGSTQILEPRIQYLYVPRHDQSNIYTYDTTLLQTDYSGLFRDRTYSGLDRIASQNRVSSGLSARIYDNALVERFNISVGQIYCFSRSSADDLRASYDNKNHSGILTWAGDTYWKIDNHWSMYGDFQYHTRLNSIVLGNGVLKYKEDPEHFMQLHYRYATQEYIQAALNTNQFPSYQHGIAQVGVTGSWLIADHLGVVGAYYYDTRARQSVDQLLGLRYNTCCWSVTLGYERQISDWNNYNNISMHDSKFSFNIALRGLSREQSFNSEEILHSSILSYQSAF